MSAARRRQRGLTLVELMVGSAVGLILLSSAVAVYTQTVASSTDSLEAAHLSQELRAVLSVMTRDIRRAGYYGQAVTEADLALFAANPFTTGVNDIRISNFVPDLPALPEAAASCILYTYDLDSDGTLTATGTGMERFGFRLRENAIEMRRGGDGFTCSDTMATTPDPAQWWDVTTATVSITGLLFELNESSINVEDTGVACATGDPCQYVRDIRITISGQLTNDTSVTQTVSETVHVRNDKFLSSAP